MTNEAAFATTAPRTMALWRCIACGAMGRLADCTGQCAFRQVSMVEAQAYADLFEASESADGFFDAARPFLEALAAAGGDGEAFEAGYGAMQAEARSLSRGAVAAVETTDDRAPVWLCDTCGAVEAPQECLGVCIRPTRDFVVAQDYDALAAAARPRAARAARARALLVSLARSRPRAGQWRRAAQHFSHAAAELLR